jgi:DNA-binding PadR family transcriptional regulator
MKGSHIGEFEELVLLAINGLGAEAYGLAVQRLLEQEASRAVSLGAVYAALDRLGAKGLVRSAITAGTPMRGGRRRRVFLLTREGTRALEAMRRLRDRLYETGGLRARKSRV